MIWSEMSGTKCLKIWYKMFGTKCLKIWYEVSGSKCLWYIVWSSNPSCRYWCRKRLLGNERQSNHGILDIPNSISSTIGKSSAKSRSIKRVPTALVVLQKKILF